MPPIFPDDRIDVVTPSLRLRDEQLDPFERPEGGTAADAPRPSLLLRLL
jgi:hypothetical protein